LFVMGYGVATRETDRAATPAGQEPRPVDEEERHLIAALRRGDEASFVALLERYHSALVRVASAYVPNRAVAEEVAQETWLAVVRGIDGFESRSSLKTWIFGILVNQARRRGQREGRCIPFSALAAAECEDGEPAVEADRFVPAGGPRAHHWASPLRAWEGAPEERLLAGEARARIQAAIDVLPPTQRTVITLRDIQGCSAAEVCDLLGLTETNQRVLLHRARSKVRRAIERYLEDA